MYSNLSLKQEKFNALIVSLLWNWSLDHRVEGVAKRQARAKKGKARQNHKKGTVVATTQRAFPVTGVHTAAYRTLFGGQMEQWADTKDGHIDKVQARWAATAAAQKSAAEAKLAALTPRRRSREEELQRRRKEGGNLPLRTGGTHGTTIWYADSLHKIESSFPLGWSMAEGVMKPPERVLEPEPEPAPPSQPAHELHSSESDGESELEDVSESEEELGPGEELGSDENL